MPDPSDFIAGFGLIKGTNISGYILENVTILHNELVRYRQYEYPITLTFKCSTTECDAEFINFYNKLNGLISKTLVINSRYGNPYECSIDFISANRNKSDNSVVFTLKGKSHRV